MPELAGWIAESGATHVEAEYHPGFLADAVMVFAATGDEALDRRVSDDARELGIPVNAVDRPELCDFYTPAIVNRAPVCVAIGTEGAAPVLAQSIRAKIDQLLSPSLGALGVACRVAARRRRAVAAERPAAPPVLERFLRRRSGARHGSRPCRRGTAGCDRPSCAGGAPATAMSRWSAPAPVRKT